MDQLATGLRGAALATCAARKIAPPESIAGPKNPWQPWLRGISYEQSASYLRNATVPASSTTVVRYAVAHRSTTTSITTATPRTRPHSVGRLANVRCAYRTHPQHLAHVPPAHEHTAALPASHRSTRTHPR